MTRDEVIVLLRVRRAAVDGLVDAVPRERLLDPMPGSTHSVRDVLVHLAGYDDLIARRLEAASRGETTAFDRDRVSWEAFNDRLWAEAAAVSADDALAQAADAFSRMVSAIGALRDEELGQPAGATAALDPAWLGGRAVWELVGIDAFDHYPLHLKALEAAVEEWA